MRQQFIRKIAFWSLPLAGGLLLGVGVAGFGEVAAKSVVAASETDPVVYICTGKYATTYHRSSKCRGLGNCKASVKSLSQSAAVKSGRKPCKACW